MENTEQKTVAKAYEVVTSRIIEIIETTNQLPWKKPWKRRWGRSVANSMGTNYVTKHEYRGINAFMTALVQEMCDYETNLWLTYRQAQSLGGNVKKGEKGIPCVFFKMLDKKGEEECVSEDSKKIFYAQYSTIFNVAQCEGFELKLPQSIPQAVDDAAVNLPIEMAENMVKAFKDKPAIFHDQGDQAFYSPALDKICLPSFQNFETPEGYYSTLFHELVHSTGHEKRLNRKSLTESHGFGSHQYSKEELVAELGACFLQADAGLFEETMTNSAAYLANWLKALKANPAMLVQAANAAQKALDYLYGEEKAKALAA